MPDPSRNPRRAHRPAERLVAVGLGALVLAGLVSCSSSSSGTEEQDAPQAAESVAGTFGLDEAGQECLEDEFEARPAGRELLTGETEPSAAAQEALVTVLDTCVGHEQFARSMALSISASLPPATDGPSGTADPTAQTECLEREILGLDEARRRAFMVGLLALGAPPTGELALARNDVTNGLYQACGVDVAG
jgi:hypothetical protein